LHFGEWQFGDLLRPCGTLTLLTHFFMKSSISGSSGGTLDPCSLNSCFGTVENSIFRNHSIWLLETQVLGWFYGISWFCSVVLTFPYRHFQLSLFLFNSKILPSDTIFSLELTQNSGESDRALFFGSIFSF
jgi:hypothetical protein